MTLPRVSRRVSHRSTPRRQHHRGITLIDLLVATALFAALTVALLGVISATAKTERLLDESPTAGTSDEITGITSGGDWILRLRDLIERDLAMASSVTQGSTGVDLQTVSAIDSDGAWTHLPVDVSWRVLSIDDNAATSDADSSDGGRIGVLIRVQTGRTGVGGTVTFDNRVDLAVVGVEAIRLERANGSSDDNADAATERVAQEHAVSVEGPAFRSAGLEALRITVPGSHRDERESAGRDS